MDIFRNEIIERVYISQMCVINNVNQPSMIEEGKVFQIKKYVTSLNSNEIKVFVNASIQKINYIK